MLADGSHHDRQIDSSLQFQEIQNPASIFAKRHVQVFFRVAMDIEGNDAPSGRIAPNKLKSRHHFSRTRRCQCWFELVPPAVEKSHVMPPGLVMRLPGLTKNMDRDSIPVR